MSNQFDKNYYYGSVYDDYDSFLDWKNVAKDLREEYGFQSFVDVGCGCGNLVKEIEKQYHDVTTAGIDISSYAVVKANQANIHCASCIEMPFNDKTFDCVYVLGTYGYLDNERQVQQAMAEAYRISNQLIVFEDVYTIPAEQSEDFDPHRQIFYTKDKWAALWQNCTGSESVTCRRYSKCREYDVIEIRRD